MKSYSNDIVSTDKLQQQLDTLTKRETSRFKLTMVLITIVAISSAVNSGLLTYFINITH
jgi:hypothetical protein